MRRSRMSKSKSRRAFKKATGTQRVNNLNPRNMRGGIRL